MLQTLKKIRNPDKLNVLQGTSHKLLLEIEGATFGQKGALFALCHCLCRKNRRCNLRQEGATLHCATTVPGKIARSAILSGTVVAQRHVAPSWRRLHLRFFVAQALSLIHI